MNQETILEVEGLTVEYFTRNKSTVAVNNISFHLKKGQILGIVGESGSGKSTVAYSIIQLLNKRYTRIKEGKIIYKNMDIVTFSPKQLEKVRGNEISMIFQSPTSSLDPVYTIGDQISEMILLHESISKKEAKIKSIELLKKVGIEDAEKRINQYPHEFSGGMQQRVLIAIAIACNPEILIADEPTTALDVITQNQILKLLFDLSQEFNISIIFITHDMGVVAQFCDRIIVMKNGEIVEQGDSLQIFESPQEDYTRKLLAAIPKIHENQEWLLSI